MPKQKEQKETVTYPPSKRKAPPFKPQRPSKLSRTATTESEKSDTSAKALSTLNRANAAAVPSKATTSGQGQSVPGSKPPPKKAAQPEVITDSEDEVNDSSDGLPDDPLTRLRPTETTRRETIDDALLGTLSDEEMNTSRTALPPDIDESATISQPLLLRLMHEHFESKDTKIDKHAIIVLQKYFDVFVRETIARAAISKKSDVNDGRASQSDVDWLDRQDLEKVAGSMLLDF